MKSSFRISVIALALLIGTVQAATLTYLRFENAADVAETDPSSTAPDPFVAFGNDGNGVVAIPGSGDTSAFPNPVPQSGSANTSVWDLGSRDGIIASTTSAYDVNTFTFEAFFNAGTGTGNNNFIASRWGADDSWGFGLGNNATTASTNIPNGNMFFLYYDGSSNQILDTGINFSRGNDYYTAIAVDSTGANSALTIFYQDLEAGGSLLSQSFNLTGTVALASNSEFAIGSLGTGTSNGWIGSLDEVRMSDTVLGESELLAIPEPSTLVLALGAIAAAGIFRLRRGN